MTVQQFQRHVLDFYQRHGRHDLPWRRTRDPWAILVSEMMLQQTLVARVVEYFPRFMKRFPTVETLARASRKSVLREWLGLGYNRRALNIHRAAKTIVAEYAGKVPSDPAILVRLPGVGPYTANAVAAFAFNKPVVVLETNIRRVFLYHFFSPSPRLKRGGVFRLSPFGLGGGNRGEGANDEAPEKIDDKSLLPLIQKTLYRKNPRLWYSALMDYGALGNFGANPNRTSAHYVKQTRFEGSRRFFRARLVAFILSHRRGVSPTALASYARSLSGGGNARGAEGVLEELQREGFIEFSGGLWKILK